MERLNNCRICLQDDIPLRVIVGTHLQEMYESLTLMPFETKDSRPILACYICCARLQNCYRLRINCLQSEELFTQTLSSNVVESVEHKNSYYNAIRIAHPVIHLSMGDDLQMTSDSDGDEETSGDDDDEQMTEDVQEVEDSDLGENINDGSIQYTNTQDLLDIVKEEVCDVETDRHVRHGDDAVGFVQIQRSGSVCTVKAKITPEHRIKNKAYCCKFTCDEKEEAILNVDCHDCAAQNGGCKHSIAFLMWLHRRSEEPSPTEKKCYWAKPKLATIGTTIKFIKAKDMVLGSVITEDKNTDNSNGDQFFLAVVQSLKENSIRNQLSAYVTKNEFKKVSLHNLINQFKKEGHSINSADDFLYYCSRTITIDECHKAEEATVCQASAPLWHELRYCRITASKFYEAAHCKTLDGALIEEIFGASVPETLAMKRGKRLESDVRAVVAKTRKIVIENCGFFLKSDWPHVGASPDGLTSEYVVEIKCPSTKKGKEGFLKNNVLSSKSKAQIQLQMFFCNRFKGLFCVADENFENNKKVEIFEEDYDSNYCTDLLEKSTNFWKTAVFPKLIET